MSEEASKSAKQVVHLTVLDRERAESVGMSLVDYARAKLRYEDVLRERMTIVKWLRANSAEICDWSPDDIADAIIDVEHYQ